MHTISQWIIHHNEADGNHRSKTSSCLIKMQQVKAWSPKHLMSSVPAALTSLKLLNRQITSPGQSRQMTCNHQRCPAVLAFEGWTTALVTEVQGENLAGASIPWLVTTPLPHSTASTFKSLSAPSSQCLLPFCGARLLSLETNAQTARETCPPESQNRLVKRRD